MKKIGIRNDITVTTTDHLPLHARFEIGRTNRTYRTPKLVYWMCNNPAAAQLDFVEVWRGDLERMHFWKPLRPRA